MQRMRLRRRRWRTEEGVTSGTKRETAATNEVAHCVITSELKDTVTQRFTLSRDELWPLDQNVFQHVLHTVMVGSDQQIENTFKHKERRPF